MLRTDDDDPIPARWGDEPPSIQALRAWAAGGDDTAGLDDDEILHRWRARPQPPRACNAYATHAIPRGSSDAAHHGVPLASLVAVHHIGFVVLDGAGKPFGNLAFVLHRRDAELERGRMPGHATVRRADVSDDDYTLHLVDVDAVTWGAPRARLAEDTTLHVRATGLEGAQLEVRVFAELRERDADVLATAKVTIRGGVGVLCWHATAELLAAAESDAGIVSLVAEVRDGDGHWSKTPVPLQIELPAVERAHWVGSPDGPAQMVVATRGIADGTAVDFDVWRVGWASEDEHVETAATVAVEGGRACATWVAPEPGEYWFSASTSAPVVCTAASGTRWLGE